MSTAPRPPDIPNKQELPPILEKLGDSFKNAVIQKNDSVHTSDSQDYREAIKIGPRTPRLPKSAEPGPNFLWCESSITENGQIF